ncbi:MAG: adenosine deaminase [Deltaproteobacteria bacterium]|nr:adenosine deaminase [Deltaproteobacteria bacterium]MBW2153311.1 adenosine deaminase [Deltaproteobacteria bacterium]
MSTQEFIRNIPKAELHLHLEGTLEPELMFEFASRNNVPIPYRSVEELRQAYRFSDLHSFLKIYYQATAVLLREQDFYDLTWAYLSKIYSQKVRHAEVFFDPQAHTSRGISFETVISGIHRALSDGKEILNISSRLIMCFLRHLPAEAAMETLQQALPFKEWICAVGLDSDELGNPPEKFGTVFDEARKEGFLTVAHAGEEGPPAFIRQAVERLRVKRIDHGVRCMEDVQLVEELRAKQIPLTVCPLSNVKLRVFRDITAHIIKQMMDASLCVTVNSDDPAYFGGYIAENYMAVQQAFHLSESDIYTLAKNSFHASFLSKEEKQAYLSELDRFVSSHALIENVVA